MRIFCASEESYRPVRKILDEMTAQDFLALAKKWEGDAELAREHGLATRAQLTQTFVSMAYTTVAEARLGQRLTPEIIANIPRETFARLTS